MERIEFVTHKGKQVLLVDITGCTPQEIILLSTAVRNVVTSQAKGSVRLLADFTGAQVSKDVITRLKEATVADAPHILKSAWVGTESFPEAHFQALKTFSSKRDFVLFRSRGEALDWLAED
ncbi:MAG TPA: hypothetical protein VEG08_02855 [Terriglobales bacterium]|nr:hypothetical protein [Terriglobales bacterium]